MRRLVLEQNQIIQPIIMPDVIAVMNLFFTDEEATEMNLHHQPVLRDNAITSQWVRRAPFQHVTLRVHCRGCILIPARREVWLRGCLMERWKCWN